MDVDEDDQLIKIQYADGVFETFTYSGFGDNAVQRVVAGKMHVVKVEVIFPGTGAITEINFCPECRPLESHDEDHHCLYLEDQTTIKAQEVVYYENFEQSNNAEKQWFNGRLSTQSSYLTTYLGKYGGTDKAPYKTFGVDPSVAGVIIDLDFYEIDGWGLSDSAEIFVSGHSIEIGKFDKLKNEEYRMGTTSLGVVWTVGLVDQNGGILVPLNDLLYGQRHHVKITVPQSAGLYGDGGLRLSLSANLRFSSILEAAGWDNIKVTLIYSCHDKGSERTIKAPTVPLRLTPSPTSAPTLNPTNAPVAAQQVVVEVPILSFLSGFCVNIPNFQMTQQTRTVQWPCTGRDNQKFLFEVVKYGVYRVKVKHSQLCLGVDNGSVTQEARVVQDACLDNAHQLWTVSGKGINQRLRVTHTNMCLSVYRSFTSAGAELVQSACSTAGAPTEIWKISDSLVATGPMPPVAVGLPAQIPVSISSDLYDWLCVEIKFVSIFNGAQAVQWDCEERSNQLFMFDHVSDGYY